MSESSQKWLWSSTRGSTHWIYRPFPAVFEMATGVIPCKHHIFYHTVSWPLFVSIGTSSLNLPHAVDSSFCCLLRTTSCTQHITKVAEFIHTFKFWAIIQLDKFGGMNEVTSISHFLHLNSSSSSALSFLWCHYSACAPTLIPYTVWSWIWHPYHTPHKGTSQCQLFSWDQPHISWLSFSPHLLSTPSSLTHSSTFAAFLSTHPQVSANSTKLYYTFYYSRWLTRAGSRFMSESSQKRSRSSMRGYK